jgi:hypothetical protein
MLCCRRFDLRDLSAEAAERLTVNMNMFMCRNFEQEAAGCKTNNWHTQ